jgi:hypothetical protein
VALKWFDRVVISMIVCGVCHSNNGDDISAVSAVANIRVSVYILFLFQLFIVGG